MVEKKYELTDETTEIGGHILHRIIALKDFGFIKKGDLGGFIEKEANLSQEGQCWVYNDAKVYENSLIYGAAQIYIKAIVHGEAEIGDHAMVYRDARVYGNAHVSDKAIVHGHAEISDNAHVFGKANICGHSKVYGNAQVYDNAIVSNYTIIYDTARIYGKAIVNGVAEIIGNAKVKELSDYMIFQNNWGSGRYFTWTRSNNMWKVGCFYGTGEELIEKAYKDSEESGRCYENYVNFVKTFNGKTIN